MHPAAETPVLAMAMMGVFVFAASSVLLAILARLGSWVSVFLGTVSLDFASWSSVSLGVISSGVVSLGP